MVYLCKCIRIEYYIYIYVNLCVVILRYWISFRIGSVVILGGWICIGMRMRLSFVFIGYWVCVVGFLIWLLFINLIRFILIFIGYLIIYCINCVFFISLEWMN